jgi:hypothetical protein
MSNIKRNLALIGATAVIASVGIGGVMAAQADTGTSPSHPAVQKSGTAEVGETADGPDQGPDANANEPGHQDANETGEADEAPGTEKADGAEGAEGAETADGPGQGPDANPNEPGHQDANETGETK